MLREAFREHSLSRTAVFERHSLFEAGQVSVEDDERSGRPSTNKTTENIKNIREFIHEDRSRTIHELADTAGNSYGVCQEIVAGNFNMRRFAAKVVPRLLTNDKSSAP
jgi:hypothetical protein